LRQQGVDLLALSQLNLKSPILIKEKQIKNAYACVKLPTSSVLKNYKAKN